MGTSSALNSVLPTCSAAAVSKEEIRNSSRRSSVGNGSDRRSALAQRNVSAQRMSQQGEAPQLQMIDQTGNIIDKIQEAIIAIADPVALAMPAQIGSNHAIVLAEPSGDAVPAAFLVTPTMHQQQWWRSWVSPFGIGQAETLGFEAGLAVGGHHWL